MMSDFQPISSSNLAAGRYDADTRQLYIKFKADATEAYRYTVMPGVAKKFMATWDGKKGSAGKFFAEHIRGLAFEKIEV
ncbi:MAG: KTSC domain-containing protein [Acidobacteriota bacterium]|nr:MAG: KTSC domain-containing protein [Acidobacteriota bacterium]